MYDVTFCQADWSDVPSEGGGGSLSRGVSMTKTAQTETTLYGEEWALRIVLECFLVHICALKKSYVRRKNQHGGSQGICSTEKTTREFIRSLELHSTTKYSQH